MDGCRIGVKYLDEDFFADEGCFADEDFSADEDLFADEGFFDGLLYFTHLWFLLTTYLTPRRVAVSPTS